MDRQNTKGEGSIFPITKEVKRKDGTSKTYDYYIFEYQGKQYSFKEKRDAVAKKKQLIGLTTLGVSSSKITVKDWLYSWLQDYSKIQFEEQLMRAIEYRWIST